MIRETYKPKPFKKKIPTILIPLTVLITFILTLFLGINNLYSIRAEVIQPEQENTISFKPFQNDYNPETDMELQKKFKEYDRQTNMVLWGLAILIFVFTIVFLVATRNNETPAEIEETKLKSIKSLENKEKILEAELEIKEKELERELEIKSSTLLNPTTQNKQQTGRRL